MASKLSGLGRMPDSPNEEVPLTSPPLPLPVGVTCMFFSAGSVGADADIVGSETPFVSGFVVGAEELSPLVLGCRDMASPFTILAFSGIGFLNGSPILGSALVLGSASLGFASPSLSLSFLRGWPFPGPGSLIGLFLGLVIFPVGGRRGLGSRCFGGSSSSSISGLSLFAWSLARKKFWTRPIWFLTLVMVIGAKAGGVGRAVGREGVPEL